MSERSVSHMDNTISSLYQRWQNAPELRDDTRRYAERLLSQYQGTADAEKVRRFLRVATADG